MANLIADSFRFINKNPSTPLVPIRLDDGTPPVWCKLEFLNPSGSTKDRIARYILEKAWRQGKICKGSVVVEASSGSTSISLALVCAQMGLHLIALVPATATNERSMIIKAYGGEVRQVEGGLLQAINEAKKLADQNGWFATKQFENPDNVEAHRTWTGQEVLAQIDGGIVDAVVSGVGTGGTLLGLFEAFSEAGCDVTPCAAIPTEEGLFDRNLECCSLQFSSEVPGVVEGISKLYANWKDSEQAANLQELSVSDSECHETTRRLWRLGFPVGPSSGLNYAAALKIAKTMGPRVVTVFPDRMERYFSHRVFDMYRDM